MVYVHHGPISAHGVCYDVYAGENVAVSLLNDTIQFMMSYEKRRNEDVGSD